MSMSTHVVGFKPPDAKWKKMKRVWDACVEADIEIPTEVTMFFEGESPDELGVRVELEEEVCCTDYSEEMQTGFEIDVKKLPKDITLIRFYSF